MNAVVNSAGTYTIVVTNNTSGCTATETIEVTSNVNLPDVTLSNASIDCNTQSIEADLFVDGPYATIEWTGPNGFNDDSINPTVSEAGEYSVIITLDNGCMIERNMTVTGDFTAPSFSYDAGIIDCNQTTVNVDITTETTTTILTTSPSGETFDTATFQTDESGAYTVLITGANGCTTNTTLQVDENTDAPPLALSGGTMLDCDTESTLLQITSELTGVNDISWTLNGSEVSTVETYDATEPGDYTVTIIADNGCETIETITITQDIVDPVISIIEPGILDCITESVALISDSDGGSYTYNWVGPNGFTANNPQVDVNAPGNYTLTATGTNGCQSTATMEVDQVINIITVEADGNDMDCIVDFSELTFDTNSDYELISWTGPQGASDSETWLVSEPGTYNVTLTDEFGCEGDATVVINDTSEQPEIQMISPDTIFLGVTEVGVIQMDVINATDYTIEWMPQEGLSCYDCPNPQYNGEGEVEYFVTVTSASGCVDTDSVFIRRDIGPETSIPNIISTNDFSNNMFTLYGNEKVLNIKEFLVYDRWGELIFSTENIPPNRPEMGWDGTFEGQKIVPGVYVYYFLIDTNIGDQKHVGDVTVME